MDVFCLPPSLRHAVFVRHIIATPGRFLATAHRAPFDNGAGPSIPAASTALPGLPPSTLNSYSISPPPTGAQLKYAHDFFVAAPPTYLFTAARFRSFPPSPYPEVAFLGRSNVGKSSLLNALFGRTNIKDAHVSKRPGRTRTMNGFGITGGLPIGAAPKEGQREAAWKRFPRGGCIVVDMPGYGGGSQEEWGREALKYLENRKQLRRTFVLLDAEHGPKSTDIQLFTHLRRQGISYQIILSKVDKLLYPGAKRPGPQKLHNELLKLNDRCRSIQQHLDQETGHGEAAGLDILCCSAEKGLNEKNKRQKLGIDEVRWAVLSACGLECDEQGNEKKSWAQDVKILDDEG